MRITKYGHSCLLVEESNAKILIDPGAFSEGFQGLTGIDAILITQEHPDHYDEKKLYELLSKNPQATVITNSGTAELVKKAGIPYRILDDGQSTTIKDVAVEGFGTDHIVIYPSIPLVRNTGYLIANKFFHPGDSYTVPTKPVEILALPTGGPWLKLSDTVDYAKQIKPQIALPIHDGGLNDFGKNLMNNWAKQLLVQEGTTWTVILDGESKEF